MFDLTFGVVGAAIILFIVAIFQ
ncbi:MAG: hypothetical protein H6R18_2721, partial [Proteobacteria bacterium]|nr:hypothetical protein [Pseudomonadota bacterium]